MSWIDTPAEITGGILVGFNGAGQGSNPDLAASAYTASESPAKGNRTNYFMHATYSPVAAPADLNVVHQIMDGTLFGTPRDVILGILGFDGFTTGWPAGGLAAFTNGSMDATLTAWCNLINTLPARPVLIRLWREMVSPSTIYGPNGASVTPNAGLNETSTTFVAAWQYVTTFIRARCANARMMWCPDAGNARLLATTSPYYPGDAYVDWNAVDAYVGSSTLQIAANMAPIYGGFNSVDGTISTKPFMVCETQIDRADNSRIGDIQNYTSAFTSMHGIDAVLFWDATPGGQYEITDLPTGFLVAFQKVVGTAPFLGAVSGTPLVVGARASTPYIQELGHKASGAATTTIVVTLSNTATAGNLIIGRAACAGGQAVSSVTDSRGNTWTVDKVGTTGPKSALCSTGMDVATLQAGDTVTFHLSGSAGQSAAIVDEFTGFQTGATRVDQTAAGTATGTARSAGTTPATTQANDLVVACFAGGSAETAAYAPAAGYSSFANQFIVDTGTTVEGEYQVGSAMAAYSPTATGVSIASTNGVVVTYKAVLPTGDSDIYYSGEYSRRHR